jgi:NAD(P)-dependent dehydrogenase (short-subunit alcohol dehydrogenase family)
MHVIPIPWVEPEDISAGLLYLASDDGRYVTGTTLVIDAGRLL